MVVVYKDNSEVEPRVGLMPHDHVSIQARGDVHQSAATRQPRDLDGQLGVV